MCSAKTELVFLENKLSIGSVTYALKGRDILRKHGFKVYIERKPSEYKSGCGYALKFNGDMKKAQEILNRFGIKNKEIE